MRPGFWKFVLNLQRLRTEESAQDLVEYALVIVLLVVTVTASTKAMAVLITTVLGNIATEFTGAVG
jgi:Flp pilus assembly pilin Flp